MGRERIKREGFGRKDREREKKKDNYHPSKDPLNKCPSLRPRQEYMGSEGRGSSEKDLEGRTNREKSRKKDEYQP